MNKPPKLKNWRPKPIQVISYFARCGCPEHEVIPYTTRNGKPRLYTKGHQNRGRKVSKADESTRCIDCNKTTNMRKLPSGREVSQWYKAVDDNKEKNKKNLYKCKSCYSKEYSKIYYALNRIYWKVRYIVRKEEIHAYYLKNKDKVKERSRLWRIYNRERYNELARNRYWEKKMELI